MDEYYNALVLQRTVDRGLWISFPISKIVVAWWRFAVSMDSRNYFLNLHFITNTCTPAYSYSYQISQSHKGQELQLLTSNIKTKNKKYDLSDFDHGIIVCARWVYLNISESAKHLGFSNTTVSKVFPEWLQFCRWKHFVNGKSHRRMARLVGADRQATITQVTYNYGKQKSFLESRRHPTLRWMRYNSRRPC